MMLTVSQRRTYLLIVVVTFVGVASGTAMSVYLRSVPKQPDQVEVNAPPSDTDAKIVVTGPETRVETENKEETSNTSQQRPAEEVSTLWMIVRVLLVLGLVGLLVWLLKDSPEEAGTQESVIPINPQKRGRKRTSSFATANPSYLQEAGLAERLQEYETQLASVAQSVHPETIAQQRKEREASRLAEKQRKVSQTEAERQTAFSKLYTSIKA